MAVLRQPLVPVGLVLVVLGAGNWYAGASKIAEQERLAAARPLREARPGDFPNLSPRSVDALLGPLQGRSDTAALAGVKADFYRVVQTGGRLLLLLGAATLGAGVARALSGGRPGRPPAPATPPGG